MNSLGERVRAYRQRAGLSQTDLAGDTLSPSYVSLIESGRRQPSRDVVEILAERLSCSVDDLVQQDAPVDSATAKLELAYARLALTNGEPASARDRLRTLLGEGPLTREIEHEATKLLAEAYQRLNDADTAISLLQPLYQECLAGRSHLPTPSVAYPLSSTYIVAGDLQAALRVAERGVEASIQAGLAQTEEHLKLEATLMGVYYETGDLALAWSRAEKIISAAQQLGSTTGQGAAYWNAALVAEARGQVGTALHLSERALALFSEGGTERNLARLQLVVAWFLLTSGSARVSEAAALLDRIRPQVQDLGSIAEGGEWENLRSLAHLLLGDSGRGLPLARRAVLHLQHTAEHREKTQAYITLGDILIAQGQRTEGVAAYHDARNVLAKANPNRKVASLYRDVAHRLTLAGDDATAMECLHRALDIAHVHCNTAAGEIAFGLRQPVAAPEQSPPQSEHADPMPPVVVAADGVERPAPTR